MNSKRRLRYGLAGLVGIAVLCAVGAWGIGGKSDHASTDRERLVERVEAFWKLRLAGDGHSIYDLIEPVIREKLTASEFTATQVHNRYFSYDIQDVRIEGDRANVRVEYEWIMKLAESAGIRPQTAITEDEWIRVDGEWYREYREPHLPGVERTRKEGLSRVSRPQTPEQLHTSP